MSRVSSVFVRRVAGLAVVAAVSACAHVEPELDWGDQFDACAGDYDYDLGCRPVLARRQLRIYPVLAGTPEKVAESWHGERPLYRPLAGDMIQVLGTNEPGWNTFMPLHFLRDDTDLSDHGLWRQALRNLDDLATVARLEHDVLWAFDGELALSDRLWARPELKALKGDPLVVFETRSIGWIGEAGDPAQLAKLRMIAAQCAAPPPPLRDDYPEFCSRAHHIFRRTKDGRWSVFETVAPAPSAP